MVQPQQCHTQSKTCTWVPQCDSGWPLKEEPNPKHRMVPVSTSFQTNFQDMGESPSGPFCNQTEHKTPLYVSPIPDPQAWAVDALNVPWENLVAYAYPPTALLPKVVQKLQSQMCRLLLIAPGWPSKPWFWDLVEMSLDVPRRLPQIRTLLKQPMNNHFHTNPASFNLHVWYLGAHRCNNEGSLQRWPRELLLLKGSQQEPSTPQNGRFSNDGALNSRWTSGIPL